ncbi:SDR family NAD(P)-dependent oxidoreductase [Streptomyces sp. NPDC028635]|uniref:SDR family NAD(P)-dependent oxidoreductase n=1 Tax=Streptomyces sp. NPDC028635 TaxID=3154800 RepID=UPI0033D0B0B0
MPSAAKPGPELVCHVVLEHNDFVMQNHRVHGVSVMPGVTFLDIVFRVLRERGFDTARAELRNVLFHEPVVTAPGRDCDIRLTVSEPTDGSRWITAESRRREAGVPVGAHRENFRAELVLHDLPEPEPLDVGRLRATARRVSDLDEMYARARAEEIVHGSAMRCFGRLFHGDGELLAELGLDEASAALDERFHLHPAKMDCTTIAAFTQLPPPDQDPFIPVYIESFRAPRPLTGTTYAHMPRPETYAPSGDVMYNDCALYDGDGRFLAGFTKLTCKRIRNPELITRLLDDPDRAHPAAPGPVPPAVAVPAPADAGAPVLADVPANVPADSGPEGVRTHLRGLVGSILGKAPHEIRTDAGFYDLGLDSGHMLSISRSLEEYVCAPLYPTLLFEFSDIDSLAAHLYAEYGAQLRTPAAQAPAEPAGEQIGEQAAARVEAAADDTAAPAALSLGCHRPVWSPLPASAGDDGPRTVVLVGSDPATAAALREAAAPARVVRAERASAFERLAADHYRLDPADPDQLDLLNAALAEEGTTPTAYVRCARVRGAGDERGALPDAYRESWALAVAVTRTRPTRPVAVLFVHPRDPQAPRPQEDALGALARTVSAEAPLLRCRAVGYDAASTVRELAAVLAAESADLSTESEVRHSGGTRLVVRHEPLPVPAGAPVLRENGVYLVTGGGGGLAALLVDRLVAAGPVRLVLTGRSAPGPELTGRIDAWRRRGAEVTFVRGDVAHPDDVSAAVARARETYGRLDGVFHCAGTVDDGLFFRKDPQRSAAVLAAKVAGTLHLDEATADDDLAFFALFSSVSASVANPGQADYAYGNAFMEHFAEQRAARPDRRGVSVAVGWPLWAEGGMRVTDEVLRRSAADTGLHPLPAGPGLDTLFGLLSGTSPRAVVTYGDQERVAALLPAPRTATGVTASAAAPGEGPVGDDIAIIGVAGRYPQAKDLDAFWRNLAEGRDCVTEVPSDRWDHAALFDPERGKEGRTYGRWGGFLDGVDRFDAAAFGISRREAELMDPQERLFLTVGRQAVENAGYRPEELARTRVGVFAGVMWNHYQLCTDGSADPVAPTALHCSVANRLSYCLNLSGPSMAVDTACSSSLTALHLAVESIRRGECALAVAGGVNVAAHPQKYLQLAQGRFLSTDGRCRAFGADGDGYVPGEGVGAVLLKPLAAALADGDHVHAVIKGSFLNHSGRTSGFTVPSPAAQAALIAEALERSGITADSVGYIEAHGTGTALGDPIEIEGLRQAFAPAHLAPGSCAVGSVKSGIGHLESAAGIAAVTKVLLQMRHRELVPSLHSERPNPHIDFASSPFFVQRTRSPWAPPQGGTTLRAGVSAFGAGGSNAHVVLESAPAAPPATPGAGPQLFVFSARTEPLLREVVRRQLRHLEELGRARGSVSEATALLAGEVAAVLEVPADALDVHESLADLGVDRLALAELERRLTGRLPAGVPLSGQASVAELAEAVAAAARPDAVPLVDIAHTLRVGRDQQAVRLAVVSGEPEDLRSKLAAFLEGEEDGEGVFTGRAGDGEPVRLEGAAELFRLGRLPEIARAWAQGAEVTWDECRAEGIRPRRVPLPAHPLEERSYWIGGWRAAQEGGEEERAAMPAPSAEAAAEAEAAAARTTAVTPAVAQAVTEDAVRDAASRDRLPLAVSPVGGGRPELDRGEALRAVEDAVRARLYLERDEIDHRLSFHEMGLDSVGAVEIVEHVGARFAVQIDPVALFDHPTVARLADHVVDLWRHSPALTAGDDAPDTRTGADTAGTDLSATDPAGTTTAGTDGAGTDGTGTDGTGPEGGAGSAGAPVSAVAPAPAEGKDASASEVCGDIAVIGMAGRFPGAEDLDTFWENIAAGRDSFTEVPPGRFDVGAVFDADRLVPGRTYSKWAAMLPEVDRFDAAFFNHSPLEAEVMDPQQRLFLEQAWSALEHAGYAVGSDERTSCGVFVGCAPGDYATLLGRAGLADTGHAFLGTTSSLLPARIGYFLNLDGPTMAVDTACSSSLVAVHLAVEAIRRGECAMALAGGVALMVTEQLHVRASKVGMLSPRGKCLPFDASADGTVLGEGVGAVVLKRLDQALADGDHIHGVIKATGVNGDGRTNGITAPSAASQAALIADVHRRAGVRADDIGYVEAHGTGTALGDPIEVRALTEVFRRATDRVGYCGIGTVKANIGHTTMAAGIAGLIKTLLALRHRELPPAPAFDTPNPRTELDTSPFFVVRERRPWEPGAGGERIATVSSFGFSGTNAHAVVAEAPEPAARPLEPARERLFAVSARDDAALDRALRRLADADLDGADAADLAFTLGVGRTHLPVRAAVVARDVPELRRKLRQLASGTPAPGCFRTGRGTSAGELDERTRAELAGRAGSAAASERVGALERLAAAYTEGQDIDWQALPYGARPRRVPLPTYPFAGDRHWVTLPETDASDGPAQRPASARQAAERPVPAPGDGGAHPLLGTSSGTPGDPDGVRFRVTVPATHWVLDEHRIGERPVLPGAAGLDLAVSAARRSGLGGTVRLHGVQWLRLIDAEAAGDLRLTLTGDGDGYRFALCAGADGPVCSRGSLTAASDGATRGAAPETLDVAAVAARCTREVPATRFYDDFRSGGIAYGPSFRVLQKIAFNDDEVLGTLRAPADAGAFALHPALLDGAQQTIAALEAGNDATLVPFSVETVEVFDTAAVPAFAHVVRTGGHRYTVRLADRSGRVCVRYEGLALRAQHTPADAMMYRPVWRPALRPDAAGTPAGGRTVVVHTADSTALAAALAARTGAGTVALPEAGAGAAETHAFLEQPLDTVYFLARTGDAEGPAEADGTALELFRLVKGLLAAGRGRDRITLRIVLAGAVPAGAEEPVRPHAAGVLGLARAIESECPRWSVACVDVGVTDATTDAARTAERIVAEPGTEPLVLLRGGERLERVFEPLRLPAPEGMEPFREGGVYVIAGGAGGIGFALSRLLARIARARLVWIGRSPEGPEHRAKAQEIAALGGEALYVRADVADEAALRRGLETVHARFGRVDGAVHAALDLRDRTIALMDEEDFVAGLAPKVAGVTAFARVFGAEPLDFLLVFSSAVSFVEAGGQANYAAASTFEDAYVQWLDRRHDYPVSVVNWGFWGSVGAVANDRMRAAFARLGVGSVEPAEGMAVLRRVIGGRVPQTLAMKADPAALPAMGIRVAGQDAAVTAPVTPPVAPAARSAAQGADDAGVTAAAPAPTPAAGAGTLPERAVRDYVAGVYAEVLKYETASLDPEATFETFGVDSLVSLNIVDRFEQDLGDLPQTLLFEHMTIGQVAAYLQQEHGERLARVLSASGGREEDTATAVAAPGTASASDDAPSGDDSEVFARAREAFAQVEAFSRDLLCRTFPRLDGVPRPGESVTADDLAARLGVVDRHRRLFDAALSVLRSCGAVTGDAHTVTFTGAPAVEPVDGARVAARYPEMSGHVTLLERTLGALGDVLAGRRNPMDVLFPKGSVALVEPIYKGQPIADHYNRLLAGEVADAARRVRAEAGRPVRVLEIGAGTGASSRTVLPSLAASDAEAHYCYTDISPAFLRHGEREFGPSFPQLAFQTLDISKDPVEQGFEPGTYDVVLGTHVLHATPDIERTLRNIRTLLRPGGVVLVNEITRFSEFLTLTFGLTTGWWMYEDAERRLPHSPLLAPVQWRQVAEAAGLRPVRTRGLPGTPADELEQSLVVAERPVEDGVAPGPRQAGDEVTPASVRSYVTGVFAEVLKYRAEDLNPAATFETFGVDSLVSLNIVDRLERDLGDLPQTLLFEHTCIDSLAEYLIAEHGARLATVAGAAPQTANAPRAGQAAPSGATASVAAEAAPAASGGPSGTAGATTPVAAEASPDAVPAQASPGAPERDSSAAADRDSSAAPERTSSVAAAEAAQVASGGPADSGQFSSGEPAGAGSGTAPPVDGAAAAVAAGAAPQPAVRAAAVEDPAGPLDIAVIGVVGRYPGSPDLEAFWRNLSEGRSCISEIPAERWDWRRNFDADKSRKHRSYSRWGGFIDGIEMFDAPLFGILPRDAADIDPQERLFLETCWELLETAGYLGTYTHEAQTGVFAGLMYGEYGLLAAATDWPEGRYATGHSAYWSLANRVSYTFDLQGPSLAVDSACSSALSAIQLACESLRRGECRMAIAGGTNLILHPAHFAALCARNMLSAADACRVFDEGADGFVPGEGAGAVLLKPLAQAEADGDTVWGVIKGAFSNAGGKVSGYTVPNPNAQARLVRQTLRRSGVHPRTVSYVETHGTGTALGDPIELGGLTKAFRAEGATDDGYCAVGSVKSNIGHLEGAAGIAAITKVLLQLKHRTLAPTIHLDKPNPKIDFAGSPFRPQRAAAPWERPVALVDGVERAWPRRAGISSFGAGGANVHMVLEEYTGAEPGDPDPRRAAAEPELFLLSALDRETLGRYAGRVADFVASPAGSRVLLADLAHTSRVGRRELPERLAVTASTHAELAERLRRFAASGEPGEGVVTATARKDGSGSGLGAEALAAALAERSWAQPAEHWTLGGRVDWRAADTAGPVRKVAFPTYPFHRSRHWITSDPHHLAPSGPVAGDAAARALPAEDAEAGVADFTGARPADAGHQGQGQGEGAGAASATASEPAAEAASTAGTDVALQPFSPAGTGSARSVSRSAAAGAVAPLPAVPAVAPVAAVAAEPGGAEYVAAVVDDEPAVAADVTVERRTGHPAIALAAHHRISGARWVPGVALLELARESCPAAQGDAGPAFPFRLGSVRWPAPVNLDAGIEQVTLGYTASATGTAFRITAGGPTGTTVARGTLVEGPCAEDTGLDLAALRERLTDRPDPCAFYDAFAGAGLEYGRPLRTVADLWTGAGESLARLSLSRLMRRNGPAYALHPALLDGALQAVSSLCAAEESYLPVGIHEIRAHGALPADCWAHIREVTAADAPDGRRRFDIRLADGAGRVLQAVDGLEIAPRRGGDAPATVTRYLAPVWSTAPLPEQGPLPSTVLLCAADTAEREALAGRLTAAGSTVVCATDGPAFARDDTGPRPVYTVPGGDPAEHARLMEDLAGRGLLPDAVVHLADAPGLPLGDDTPVLPFVLWSAVAVLGRPGRPALRVVFAHRAGARGAEPVHTAVGATLRTLALEHSTFGGVRVQLAADGTAADAVLAELRAVRPGAAEVAYDDAGVRTEKNLEPFEPPAAGLCDFAPRAGGTYLITGGAGALGLHFATYLAERSTEGSTIVLVSRSRPGEEAARRIEELDGDGVRVVHRCADLTDARSLADLVASVGAEFGPLRGVLHSAGVTRDARAVKKTAREVQEVLAPKVRGTVHLDEATADQPLDFFVVFSSMSGESGNPGQADYAYANAFLNAFAARRDRLRAAGLRSGRSLSIGWPLWADGGMTVDDATRELFARAFDMVPLSTRAGLEAFVRALAADVPALCVVESPVRRRAAAAPAGPVQDTAPSGEQAALDGAVLRELVERESRELASGFLLVDPSEVDVTAELLELGFDSITLTELVNKVNERFGLDLLPTVLFECPDLVSFAGYLTEHHAGELARHYAPRQDSVPAAADSDAPEAAEGAAAAAPGTEAQAPDPVTDAQTPDPVTDAQAPAPVTEPRAVGPVPAMHAADTGAVPAVSAVPEDVTGGEVTGAAVTRTVPVAAGTAEGAGRMEIAVVGIAGTFPGSQDADAFWEHLAAGDDLIRPVPEDRTAIRANPATRDLRGGFLDSVDTFDARLFGIAPNEAALMDPQQRLFLQTSWRVFEDAGYRPADLAGTSCGLFVGVATHDYDELLKQSGVPVQAHTATGIAHSVLANRVSYLLDLHGPSEAVDTACSSSLVAIHRAVRALRDGECDMAVAGGVNVILTPGLLESFRQSGMLSPDGRCKTFDAGADGYVRGEGVGAVLLKPLARAEADGDHIYAVVRGSAVNHGGRSNSLTAPNPESQARVVAAAVRDAGIAPDTITCVEAHGTGTRLGDPVEIEGLKKAFTALHKERGEPVPDTGRIAIGAVKTNIGHLETAAGIAGVIKVVQAMRHRVLPASLHLRQLNPYLRLDGTPFRVNDRSRPWEPALTSDGRPVLRAGISSFGFGGSNAHVVLEAYPARTAPAVQEFTAHTVPLSAGDPDDLRAYAGRLAEHLARTPEADLARVAYTLQTGRTAHRHRFAVEVRDREELIRALERYAAGAVPEGAETGTARRDAPALRGDEDPALLRKAWCEGAEVPWHHRWPSVPGRVPLPTAPFARTRHWFRAPDVREETTTAATAGPTATTGPASAVNAGSPATPGTARPTGTPVTAVSTATTAPTAPARPAAAPDTARPAATAATAPAVPTAPTVPAADAGARVVRDRSSAGAGPAVRGATPRGATGAAAEAGVGASAATLRPASAVRPPAAPAAPATPAAGRPGRSASPSGSDKEAFMTARSEPRPTRGGPRIRLMAPVSVRPGTAAGTIAASVPPPPAPVRATPPSAPAASPAPVPADEAAPPAGASDAAVIALLRGELSQILGMPPEDIEDDAPFGELGLDSIYRMDLVRTLNETFGLELKAAELYNYDTVSKLTEFVSPLVGAPAPDAPEPAADEPDPAGTAQESPGRLEDVLVALVEGELGRTVDPALTFTDNGFSSFDMLRVIAALERGFGALRKTLLFDHPTVGALAAHLAETHGPQAARRLTAAPQERPGRRPVTVREPSSDGALVVEKTALPQQPEIAATVADLEAAHGREGGLPGRDIAPLIFLGAARTSYFNFSVRDDAMLTWSYVGPSDDMPALAAEFVRYGQEHGLAPNIVSLIRLEEVDGVRFTATPFGALQRLEGIADFSLEGGPMQRLRYMVRKFEKAGACRTTEYTVGSDHRTDQEITTLIDRWAAAKEMVNPYVSTVRDEISRGILAERHRMFLTYLDERMVSAVIVTKIPSEEGYLLDLEFYPEDAPLGSLDYTVVKIIEQTAAEGCTVFSFGGSFGAKVCESPNAAPEAEAALTDLRSRGIFTGDGNLRFKNKFRTTNLPLYLCQPADAERTDVSRLILMIANPEVAGDRAPRDVPAAPAQPAPAAAAPAQPSPAAAAQAAPSPAPAPLPSSAAPAPQPALGAPASRPPLTTTATPASPTAPASPASPAAPPVGAGARDRERQLSANGWNPLHLPSAAVEFDLITDSWAELDHPFVRARTAELHARTAGLSVGHTLEDLDLLPFSCVLATGSGRAAEAALCRAWPRQGVVVHNSLFPTWYFSHLDHGFTPVQARRAAGADDGVFRGDLDLDHLDGLLTEHAGQLAFLCVEVANNAQGGAALSLDNLGGIRRVADAHGVPLVLDATRVLDNAALIAAHESGQRGRDALDVAREMLSLADSVTISLSKNFGVDGGGVVATDDPAVAHHLRERLALRGPETGRATRALAATALSDLAWAAAATGERVRQVAALRQALAAAGAPVVDGASTHCVLLDTARVSALRGHEHPVPAFLAWLYLHTGIRAAAHLDGGSGTSALVRLALPVGLGRQEADEITARLTSLFAAPGAIPELLRAPGDGPAALASYHPVDQVPDDIREAMAEGHTAENDNWAVLREHHPQVERLVLRMPQGEGGGDVEVFTTGEGPVLLMMLPFNIGAGLFGPQFAALGDRYRVIVVHHPGVGATTACEDLTYEGIADLNLRVLRRLGVDGPVHVAGASFGGITAQTFALRHPQSTTSLTLIGSSYKLGNRAGEVNRLALVAGEDFDRVQAHSGSQRLDRERDGYERLLLRCESMDPQTGLRYLDVFAAAPDLLGRLGDIAVPTLIVQGRHDTVIPQKTAHLLHGAIPDARYHEVADAGHFPSLSSAEEFNTVLSAFLEEFPA